MKVRAGLLEFANRIAEIRKMAPFEIVSLCGEIDLRQKKIRAARAVRRNNESRNTRYRPNRLNLSN
jgi:hypothetical protein